jgi:hypothetical protein
MAETSIEIERFPLAPDRPDTLFSIPSAARGETGGRCCAAKDRQAPPMAGEFEKKIPKTIDSASRNW